MLAVLADYPDARIYSYGGYERTFIKRMREGAQSKKFVDRILSRLVNALSIIYAHFYFPTYSNGLKEIGAVLGCTWSDDQASGLTECRMAHALGAQFGRAVEGQAAAIQPRRLRSPRRGCRLRAVDRHDGGRRPQAPRSDRRLHAASHADRGARQNPIRGAVEEVRKSRSRVRKQARVFRLSAPAGVRARQPSTAPALPRTGREPEPKVRSSRRVRITASKCSACGKRNLDTIVKPTTDMGMITRSKRTFHLQITELGIKRQVIDYRAKYIGVGTAATISPQSGTIAWHATRMRS